MRSIAYGSKRRPRRPVGPQALAISLVGILAVLLAGCSAIGGAGWQPLGQPSGHIILSLAVDPHQHSLVYAGDTNGEVYRSLADKSGQPIAGTGIPHNTVVGAILPDPRTAGTLYAATGAGLYVSTNYADTWSPRGNGFPHDDTMDALVFGGDPTTLFAGSTQHGVYVSHDLGRTWLPTATGLPMQANVNALLWQSATNTLYAAIDGAGIYASQDGGASWAPQSRGIPTSADVFALAVLPQHGLAATQPTLYAGTAKGVYASVDGGAHWDASSQGLPAERVLSLAVDSTHPGWLYAGTDTTVYRAVDGGHTWRLVAPGLTHQVTSIVAVPSTSGSYIVYAGTDQLDRFPPTKGSGPAGPIATVILLMVLLVLVFVVIRRSHQRLLQDIARLEAPRRPRPSTTPEDAPRE